jgi:hypothetical protein
LQWSKLKAKLENFLCDKLKGRIQIHATVYRKFHDSPSRVWITLDKKIILGASDATYAVEHEKLYHQIKKERMLNGIVYNPDWNVMFNSEDRQELLKASEEAEKILIEHNIFESYHLYELFMNYSSLSIKEARKSENIFVQAFSLFDRRLGKRRLKDTHYSQGTHPLIIEFYKIRCDIEGLH